MSFFEEKKYNVTDSRGINHLLTAKQIYERVLQDSKNNYNWIISAQQLVEICNEPSFSKSYAQAIKIMILNCFADLESQREFPYSGETDKNVVDICYHSLTNENEKAIKVKEKYLTSVITSVVKYTKYESRTPRHQGPVYKKMCKEWEKAKFEEYVRKEKIDFYKLREKLNDDFEDMIEKGEKAGKFKKDDAEYHKKIKLFWELADSKHNIDLFV